MKKGENNVEIKTKLSIGDIMYPINSTTYIGRETCQTCDGAGNIKVKNWDDQFCPRCYGNGYIENYGVKEWRIDESFSGLKVGRIDIEIKSIRKNSSKYEIETRYFPVGYGNWINEENIFVSKEEALLECEKRNKEIEKSA